MWETIPGVIRNSGTDACRVEVNVNGTVSNVMMRISDRFVSDSGLTNVTLRDDGLQGDRISGDSIFTSETIRYNTNYSSPEPAFYEFDTNSPAGVSAETIGTVTVTETNGAQTQFLIGPEVGILDMSVPLVQTAQLSSNVIVSPHLGNVRGTNLIAQKILRNYASESGELPKKIYAVFPDAFDFLVYFSTYRVEVLPYATSYNLVAGTHQSIQVNYSGTGQTEFNNSVSIGSAGKLLGVNVLDTYDRGILSGVCAHEILHQWGSYMSAFPFSDGQHYTRYSNVGSLLGGFVWTDNGEGTWTLNCNEGASGATHLDLLDQYLMGLIGTNLVDTLRVYSPTANVYCFGLITNVAGATTIQDIVSVYGERVPGPATAKRDFSIGFVAESNQRLLNQVEMTYYDIFAAHFTRKVPAENPDPYVGPNWAPVTRFFGTNTTWKSDVLPVIQPVIQSVQLLANEQCRIIGEGLPGWRYRLQSSTDLQTWLDTTNKTADTNGTIAVTDAASAGGNVRFYRLIWP
jgi:hypothetical protein